MKRFLQLGLLGWCMLLLMALATALTSRDFRGEVMLFSWWLIPASLAILQQNCRELPALGFLSGLSMVITLGWAVILPQFVRCCHCPGQLTACKSNLKNVATSLEMYSTDNAGRYPRDLDQLTPNYLKTIPRCPAAEKDTYSNAYMTGLKPDAYTVMCGGCHHHATGINQPNYPQYSSYSGLILP